ncbi:MAG: DUF4433 domain-containing protein [Bacteroidetes bacterium]|nr:DUF4433 domain-containing protein [Bacteroidota bacterium]
MTHIKNIPHILKHGITHYSSMSKNKNYIAIGDGNLINTRNDFVMPNGKTLGEYIPFYFGPHMPMLYVMQKGFNGVTPSLPQDIVYCITSVEAIQQAKLDYVFTNGHAVDRFSEFYYPKDIKNILKIIDTKAIDEKYWKKESDLDLKRRKEAEFLVEGDIPIAAIQRFAVYDQTTAAQIKKMGWFQDQELIVKPNYYF